MRLLYLSFILWVLVGSAARADEIVWGQPYHGLRAGIAREKQDAPLHQPLFDVIVENISTTELTLPSAASYMEKVDEKGNKFLAAPLYPQLPGSTYASAQQSMTSTRGDGGDLSRVIFTLKPGESRKFEAVPLQGHSYWERDRPEERMHTLQLSLLPDSTNTVEFYFENQQPKADGRVLWTGKALSGKLEIKTPPASLEGFNLEAAFSLPKQDYYIGEPIYVEFKVTNKGDKTVWFPAGGDYRMTGRHDRFKIVVTDEDGKELPDPAPHTGSGGGLGGDIGIVPELSYTEQVLANSWCAFMKPGHYTLTCTRTLNLKEGTDHNLLTSEQLLPALRVQTKLSINLVRDDEAKRKLIASLPSLFQTDPNRAREQLHAFAYAQDEDALPAIEQVVANQKKFANEAIWWLRSYEGHKAAAIPVLLRLAQIKSPASPQAITILYLWKAPEAAPVVKKLLASDIPLVREAAVQACNQCLYPECLEVLLKMGDDPFYQVRQVLGSVLGRYGDQRAVPVLLKLLRDPDPNFFIRIRAAQGLGELGRKDGIPPLIELLNLEATRGYRDRITEVLRELTEETLTVETYDAWHAWWEQTGKAKFGKQMG